MRIIGNIKATICSFSSDFSLQVMREGGFSTPLCHYAIMPLSSDQKIHTNDIILPGRGTYSS